MLPIVEIEIDENALVACPKADFRMTYANKVCSKCENFNGIAMMSSDYNLPWHLRYVIRCNHIMERRTHIINFAEN